MIFDSLVDPGIIVLPVINLRQRLKITMSEEKVAKPLCLRGYVFSRRREPLLARGFTVPVATSRKMC